MFTDSFYIGGTCVETKQKQIYGIMLFYSLSAILTAILTGDLSQTLQGFWTILSSPAQLTMDYFKLGTVGGTFLNVGLTGLSCVVVFALSRFAVNGLSLMSFFLTIGFSFFGMNFLNIWPCILGTWVFTRVAKLPFKSQVNIAIFATSLSPFVSEGMWRHPAVEAPIARVLFGVMLGVVCGFLMPILAQHGPSLHKGYSLYNAASVAGFIGVMLFAFLFRSTGFEIPGNTDIGDSHALVVNAFAIATSLVSVLAGFLLNGRSFKGFFHLLTRSSAYRCDFTNSYSVPVTMINIGMFGLFVTGYYNLIGASMTGPTAGSIICLLAVTPCGTHIFNMIPMILGYLLASTFCAFDLTTQAIIVGLCFCAALSPIPSRFGSLSGIVAGLLHAVLVTTVVTFHGGFCLYNGGFTAGITAIILVPVLEFFLEPKDTPALLPTLKKWETQ